MIKYCNDPIDFLAVAKTERDFALKIIEIQAVASSKEMMDNIINWGALIVG